MTANDLARLSVYCSDNMIVINIIGVEVSELQMGLSMSPLSRFMECVSSLMKSASFVFRLLVVENFRRVPLDAVVSVVGMNRYSIFTLLYWRMWLAEG